MNGFGYINYRNFFVVSNVAQGTCNETIQGGRFNTTIRKKQFLSDHWNNPKLYDVVTSNLKRLDIFMKDAGFI